MIEILVDFESKKTAIAQWIESLSGVVFNNIRGADQTGKWNYPAAVLAEVSEIDTHRPIRVVEEIDGELKTVIYASRQVMLDISFVTRSRGDYTEDPEDRFLDAEHYMTKFHNSLYSPETSIEFLAKNGLSLLSVGNPLRTDEKRQDGWLRRHVIEIGFGYVAQTSEPVSSIDRIDTLSGAVHIFGDTHNVEITLTEYQRLDQKGQPQGYAELDAEGQVPASQITVTAFSKVFSVANEAEQLALIVKEGDIAVRIDQEKTYAAKSNLNESLADWLELLSSNANAAAGASAYKSPDAQMGKFGGAYGSKSYIDNQDNPEVKNGSLTFIDSDDQGVFVIKTWSDGYFLYAAASTLGLLVYSVSQAGILTFIGSDDQGGLYNGVWGDGNFIYVTTDTLGLLVYSVSPAGILTLVDSDDQDDPCKGIWGDGNFIYVTTNTLGLLVYSVSPAGILTLVDSDDQGGLYQGVHGDSNYIYVGTDTLGLLVYSVSPAGILTLVDSDNQGGLYQKSWSDGNFIYVGSSTLGLLVYSVSPAGVLTLVDSDDQGGFGYSNVWGDGKFIYTPGGISGVYTYLISPAGILTFIGSIALNFTVDVYGDGKFIYVGNSSNSLAVYSVQNAYSYDKTTGVHNFAQNNFVATHFQLVQKIAGISKYVSNGTTPDGNLPGVIGDVCYNGPGGKIFYCTGTTNWT